MKAVARLLLTYFAGARVTKYLTLAGLALMVASLYVVFYLPQNQHASALAVPGVMIFFFGTSLMPVTLGRLAQSHMACILPGARVKLLLSAILTVLLVALPAGLLSPMMFLSGMSANIGELFLYPGLFEYTIGLALVVYTSACIAATWLYVFIWFVTNERNLAGIGKAVTVLLGLLVLTMVLGRDSQEREPGEWLLDNVRQLAVVALVFSVGFLGWPRFRRWRSGRSRSAAPMHTSRDLTGKEIDLLLGNANPWVLIAVLAMTLTIAARTGELGTSILLFYLSIASTVSGATAGQAPARSRALWLRGGWSRAELFSAIEKSAWRHNSVVMFVLLMMLLVAGIYANFSPPTLLAGAALIAIGAAFSTYLGLMLTRGVRWPEATAGALVMLTLMAIALMLGEGHPHGWLGAGLLVALGLLSVILRQIARSRWARIDWSQCRGVTQRALRAG